MENRRVLRRLWWALAVLLALAVSGSSAQQASANWGGLDPSFAEGGFRIDPFGPTGGYAGARAAALDSSGRLVVAGRGALAGTITLVRYEEDGSLDPSFGVGGVATFQVSAGTEPSAGVVGMYLEEGGGIVLAGNASGREPGEGIVVRVKSDGSGLDESFGEGGIAVVPGESGISDFGESAGGKPVVAGRAYPGDVAFLARLTHVGAPDSSFGSEGEVRTEILSEKGFNQGGFDAVVVAGEEITAATGLGSGVTYLARYDSEGNSVTGFGNEGIATVRVSEKGGVGVSEMTDLSEGRLLLAGYSETNALLAETQPDGSLDPTFGNGGVVTTGLYPHGSGGGSSVASSAVVEPDGHIVIAGVAEGTGGGCFDPPGGCKLPSTDYLALARYSSSGELDETFGEGGIAHYLFGLEQPATFGVGKALLDGQGRLLVAGAADPYSPSSGRYLAARFLLKEGEYHPEEPPVKEPPEGSRPPEQRSTCVVPSLKGRTPKKARRLLARAGCQLGQVVRRPKGSSGSLGRASSTHGHSVYVVARSKPAAGRTVPAGERVRLILISRANTG
jgi:uncharacterized delta-60 repeat protein